MRYENRTGLKNKGKVGVVTLPGSFNYGCELQLFAVIHIYRELGYSPEFLVFNRSLSKLHGVVERARGNHDAMPIELLQSPGRRAAFKRFETMIHSVQIEKPQDINLNDYALFSVGSDQVWNSGWNKGILRPFYLSFAPDSKKKIAYSASFGKPELSDWEIPETKQLLSRYDAISVREDSAVDILENQLGIHSAEHVLDPTMAVPRKFWIKKILKRRIKEKYVLVYQLNSNPEFERYQVEFAKKHDLLHVLPLLCNSDFFGIGEIHGQLIRCGTCGNSDVCDYMVVGNTNPIAQRYETVTDEKGFLVSRRKYEDNQ